MKLLLFLGICLGLCAEDFCPETSSVQAGAGTFQRLNIDAEGNQNDTYYPRVGAPDKVRATSFFEKDNMLSPGKRPVYRLRSWAGSSMLWGTNSQESGTNGYFLGGSDVRPSGIWPSPVFQQGTVIASPILCKYSLDPNSPDPDTQGVLFSLPYPYLKRETSYEEACQTADDVWKTDPLSVAVDPIPMLLMYPTDSVPTSSTTGADASFFPPEILVDHMGDFSIDLIYQDPDDPYERPTTDFPDGRGKFIKMTITQGCPFIYVTTLGIKHIVGLFRTESFVDFSEHFSAGGLVRKFIYYL